MSTTETKSVGADRVLSTEPILEIKNVSIAYPIAVGTVHAVEDVSVTLRKGEILGLVGESGCGKSTIGLSILRLLKAPGKVTGGQILYKGDDILKMSGPELHDLRGRHVSMIFQNPLTSLNPVHTIAHHFVETLKVHEPKIKKPQALERAAKMLEALGIESKRLDEYPFQLSGGMRQRIMIGLALILNPDVVVADEPTTALDVIVEASFIDLIARLRDEFGVSIILVTHNLGVVAEIADRIAVMYGGKMMEVASAEDIFKNPMHPYTQGLMACVPNIMLDNIELPVMPGSPPDLVTPPKGCRFAARCPKAMDICRERTPELRDHGGDHQVACWLNEPEGREV